jgi:amino acid adenylation domain-containing protein
MKQDKPHGGVAEVTVEQPDVRDLLASEEGSEYNTFLPSYAQQRLWFLDQLEPGNPLYNIPAVIRVGGPLSVPALERTLTKIVARHEALRTTFATLDSHPVQVIRPPFPVAVHVRDLSALPEAKRESEAMRLALAEAQRPFDLGRGPLLRAGLIRLGEMDHVFTLTLHHIVSDGWSMGVMIKEMVALYEAFVSARPSPLSELEIQYADYAVWQREWLEGEVLEGQLAYWKAQLSRPPALDLPTDKRRPPVQSFAGAVHITQISATLHEALKTLSQREGVTLFMTLLAALKVMLWRYSGQTDVIVGSPIAGRTRVETEPLIGLFLNTLALRTDLSGDPTFRELLARVREVTLGAYAHQDVPFERLVEELQPERSLSRAPLFQVMLMLQNTPAPDLAMAGLPLARVDVSSGTSKFDLTLLVEEGGGGIAIHWEYNTDLFEAGTIARMGGHFETLLESAVARPAERISLLPVLTQAERQQLLFDFNDTRRDYPEPRCIHELFEAQVERTPAAVALISDTGERLTYRELSEQADELAHHLMSLGVGPEVRVGVLLERSVALVISLLSVLKAGGAYVPLDPNYPRERVGFMVEDAGVAVLLTQTSLREKFHTSAARVVCLDDPDRAQSEATPDALPTAAKSADDSTAAATPDAATPDNLAYVIYTSGSTGRPKGVAITHRSVSTFLHWAHETFTQAELAGVLASTSVCFDLSVFELFAPLTCGGSVILAENALALPAHTAAAEVTLLNTVPSAMAELARAQSLPASVVTVNLAGEPLKSSLVEAVYEQETVKRVLNLYGPSEDTTYSTYVVVERGTDRAPTIGRPVANTQVYLLDGSLQLVPVGVAGELYLGGAGLARGYLNRPGLTAEKFVPDPFAAEAGRRLYRTGDVARYLAGGELEFLGRIDHQVKVRGFRIELGEVEAALIKHESVREAVVAARADDGGDQRLVAYVVGAGAGGPQLGVGELRNYLKARLPEYMIPSAFVFLDELPLTPNGKVDRKMLPQPDQSRPESGGHYVAPRTPVEEVLCGLWAEVLRVGRVGVEDNFFELGGHSLLATRLAARVREAFRVELPLRALFERQTVAGLAAEVERGLRAGLGQDSPPLLRADRARPLPLSFAQQRLWFLDQLEPGNPLYNIPIVLRLEGQLNADALKQSLSEVVRRHEALRTTITSLDEAPAQIVSASAELTVAGVDLSTLPAGEREAEVRRLSHEEAQRPFDLARGPLFRATLLRLSEAEHVLLLTMHHIVSDGWSMQVLAREVAALYAAFRQGQPSPLPELEIQYADYAVWQREWLQGTALEEQLDYWRQRLADTPPVLELPTDRPRLPQPRFAGASLPVSLPARLTEDLKSFSRRAGVTPFMTLLAAWQVLLSRYTGQTDIAVGVPVANRQRSEVEGLIGLFVNTLVLRTDLSGDPTFIDLLGRVRETALGAYAHQDLPFEKLVEDLQPARSLNHTPLFQVLLNWQPEPSEEFSAPDLRLSVMPTDSGTAKFDLTLTMFDARDGFRGHIGYSTDLFDEATIVRLAGHFETLLDAAVRAPEQNVSTLPLLTPPESRQLLVEWNQTRRDYALGECVHELFEAQSARTPDAVAVVYEDARLTYEELNARANQLARHLMKLGVGPESLVGVCMERSVEAVVALLGVLKAGGAYVPLDPDYPAARLQFMLADAGVTVLLTKARLLKGLPEPAARVVRVDEDWPEIAREQTGNVRGGARPDNLAYVIYTSGSTGQPKGAMLHHRGVVNSLRWMQETHGLSEQDSFLLKTSLNFDPSVWEVFWPLIAGATVHIARPGGQLDSEYLARYIAEQGITTAYFVPSMLRVFLAEPGAAKCTSLRRVICGGESLPLETMRRFCATLPATLYHSYGPTEISITASAWRCEPEGERRQVSIGYARANTPLYVLDSSQGPVPIGLPGELYVGGVGVGRGYLNRAGLTAERFIPDPFSAEPGARLYRTGDLVRRAADGALEFVARVDSQVKLRGFRIELGEVEAALREHQGVHEASVAIREGAGEDQRLAAYVVAAGETRPSVNQLRAHLKARLPEYMIPSAFVFLDELPLTPNGKVDRKALPAPDASSVVVGTNYVAPRTPVEEALVGIWAEVLGAGRVGVEDNFFELGGHSLLATQLISRIRGTLKTEVPLRSLFETPTVAGLARAIEQNQSQPRADVQKIQPRQRGKQNLQQLLSKLDYMADGEVRSQPDDGQPR